MDKWIDFKATPPTDPLIIALMDGCHLCVAMREPNGHYFVTGSFRDIWDDRITHWLPVPPMPAAEGEA